MKQYIAIGLTTLILVSFLACSDDDSAPDTTKKNGSPPPTETPPVESPAPEELTFSGISDHGIFDPSLAKNPTEDRIWMSFSAVSTSALWTPANIHTVSSHLAYSDDGGENWVDSGEVPTPRLDVTLNAPPGFTVPDPSLKATWQSEVSKVLYDAEAAPSARWKLFTHRFLLLNGIRRFEHGWIEYKEANSPEGLDTATAVKLFVGSLYNSGNDSFNNPATRSPLGGIPVLDLDTLDVELNSCLTFTEPGAISNSTALYLSFLCPTAGENYIVLIKCDHPCDPSQMGSWSYVGRLLDESPATDLAYHSFSAPDIFVKDGDYFLMVSPTSDDPVTDAYNGCLVFQFSDLDGGILLGGNETPTLISSYFGLDDSFNGACAFHEGASTAGIFHSQLSLDLTKFQIFLSFQDP